MWHSSVLQARDSRKDFFKLRLDIDRTLYAERIVAGLRRSIYTVQVYKYL